MQKRSNKPNNKLPEARSSKVHLLPLFGGNVGPTRVGTILLTEIKIRTLWKKLTTAIGWLMLLFGYKSNESVAEIFIMVLL